MGYVGSVMALAVADARCPDGSPRFDVIGVDLPSTQGKERVDGINGGSFPISSLDSKVADAYRRARAAGNLSATTDPGCFEKADVILVDVNLDVKASEKGTLLDWENLRTAIRTIGNHMRPESLVIVESTVPPGTCEKIVAPDLKAGLRTRGLDPEKLTLAHAYERAMPGTSYLDSVRNYWRVYAGYTPSAADACHSFLSQVVN